jgi:hypothetical protein
LQNVEKRLCARGEEKSKTTNEGYCPWVPSIFFDALLECESSTGESTDGQGGGGEEGEGVEAGVRRSGIGSAGSAVSREGGGSVEERGRRRERWTGTGRERETHAEATPPVALDRTSRSDESQLLQQR